MPLYSPHCVRVSWCFCVVQDVGISLDEDNLLISILIVHYRLCIGRGSHKLVRRRTVTQTEYGLPLYNRKCAILTLKYQFLLERAVLDRHSSEVIHSHQMVTAARDNTGARSIPGKTVDCFRCSSEDQLLPEREAVLFYDFLGHSERKVIKMNEFIK